MKAYLHTKTLRADGNYDNYLTVELEVISKPLPWQKLGLSYTASGYGSRIPTEYMVKHEGKWKRVYCIVYSNSGSLYIGKKFTPCLTVSIEREGA